MTETYKITLSDGTALDNLRLNGNNFISAVPVSESIFGGNCSPVVVDGPEDGFGLVGTHKDMELVQITEQVPGEWWFVLRDLTAVEVREQQARADLDFLLVIGGYEG